MKLKKHKNLILILNLPLLACSGGGGGNTPTSGTQNTNISHQTITPTIAEDIINYAITYGIETLNKPQFAIYDENEKKIIGVTDAWFGSDDLFKDEQGKWRVNIINKQPNGPNIYSHGSKVTGVIAQNNKDSFIYLQNASYDGHGIYWGSDAFTALYNKGVRIFNQSFGDSSDTDRVASDLNDIVGNMPEIDSIFVWAAGNDAEKGTEYSNHASPQALYPAVNDNARNGWIAVSAVSSLEPSHTTKLADYSNEIGEKAKTWGITALGDQTVKFTTQSVHDKGTSFATPMVSATLANVWNKFPWMDNHLVTVSVLSTANKPGTTENTEAPDAKFGWGILNPERALKGPGRFDKQLLTNKDDKTNSLLTVNFDYREYVDKDKLTWSNDIAGDAGILKKGTSVLYLSGKNTYTGETKIENGTLAFSNDLTQSKVTIEHNGTFLAQNKDRTINVGNNSSYNFTNHGSLNVYGKGLKINGSYEGSKDSRIVIDIDKSHLEVTQTMNMNGSRIVGDIEDIISSKSSTRTLVSAGSITNYNGEYKITDTISPYINISNLAVNGKTISITYHRNNTEYVLSTYKAPTPSALNTAKNIDRVFEDLVSNKTDKLFNSQALGLLRMTPASLSVAIDTLSGEIHASGLNILATQNNTFNKTLSDRMVVALKNNNSGFWVDGVYNNSKIMQKGYANAEINVAGSQIGIDKKIDNVLLGIAINQSKTTAKFDKFAGKDEIKNVGISTYGSYLFDELYLSSRIGFNYANSSISRDILNTSSNIKYNSKIYNLYTEAGLLYNFNKININPFIANEFVKISRNKFTENKAFGLASNKKDYNLHSIIGGFRADTKFNNFTFGVNLFHIYTPNPSNFNFSATYYGNNVPISIKGISQPEHATYIGMLVDYKLYEALTFNFKYDTNVNSHKAKNNIFRLGARWEY